ncbi:hypothetical protein Tco_0085678 [Tanacetum coccineum]
MNDLESNDESVNTPLVSPFPHSYNDSDDGEVLNELIEYANVGMLRREKAINSFNRDDLAFQCMIGFRKSVAYFDPFLSMNIITCKAYNTIMVEGLESTGKNLVVVVRDVYMFVRSFTYITDFVVLEDIGEFIQINKAEVIILDKKKLGRSHDVFIGQFLEDDLTSYHITAGIKRLLDDLRVTAAQLMLLVYKLLLLKAAERVSTVRERIKTEERIMII